MQTDQSKNGQPVSVGSTGGSALVLGHTHWISMAEKKPTTGNLPFLIYSSKRQPKLQFSLMVERCPTSPDWEYWAEVTLPNTELRDAHTNT